jgi:hypothetical protein
MSPNQLMLAGSVSAVAFLVCSFALTNLDVLVPMFAAGAVFGKGYGVWECRTSAQTNGDGDRG